MPAGKVRIMKQFWIVTLGVAIVGCGSKASVEPTTAASLRSLVPEELQIQPIEVAAEDNGYRVMVQATEALSGSLDSQALASYQRPTLAKATRQRGEALLKRNSKALGLLEQADAKPVWQAPIGTGADTKFTEMPKLRNLTRLLLLRAALAQSGGNGAAAAKDLALVFRVSQRLLESQNSFVGYLVGLAIQAQVTQAIRTAIWRPGMSAASVEIILNALEKPAKDPYVQSIRGEFNGFLLPELAKTTGPGANLLEEVTESQALASDVRQALEGHAQPFDREATVREAVWLYRELLRNAGRPLAEQVDVPALAVQQASVWGSIVTEGSGRISPAELPALKARLAKEKNPYGRLVLWIGLPSLDFGDERRIADLDMTRIAVANRLYAFKHRGRTAPSLNALGLNLLDPYSGKPYGYDARRGIVWSVSKDGKDDGGSGTPGAYRPSNPDWAVSIVGK